MSKIGKPAVVRSGSSKKPPRNSWLKMFPDDTHTHTVEKSSPKPETVLAFRKRIAEDLTTLPTSILNHGIESLIAWGFVRQGLVPGNQLLTNWDFPKNKRWRKTIGYQSQTVRLVESVNGKDEIRGIIYFVSGKLTANIYLELCLEKE